MTREKTPINWRKVGRIFTGGTVGVIAAIASFDHQRSLAMAHGQHGFIGSLFPISVDVLILCATFAMDGRNRFWPRAAFWAGVGATISANVLAAPPDLLSQAISAWAPVALLFVVEIEARRNKTEKWRFRKATTPAVEVPAVNTEAASLGATVEDGNAISTDKPKPRTPNSKGVASRQKVAKVAAKLPEAPPSVIAAKAGVSESTARRYLPPVPAPQPEPVAVS